MDAIIGSLTAGAVQYSPGAITAPVATPMPAPTSVSGSGVAASAVTTNVAVGLVPDSKSTSSPALDQIQKSVDDINAAFSANQNTSKVQFAIDTDSKKVVVQMIDTENGTVISQFPSEEIIHMGMALGQKLGRVIDQQA